MLEDHVRASDRPIVVFQHCCPHYLLVNGRMQQKVDIATKHMCFFVDLRALLSRNDLHEEPINLHANLVADMIRHVWSKSDRRSLVLSTWHSCLLHQQRCV